MVNFKTQVIQWMQNPTELTGLREFQEWKEKCDVKGQPFCSLPNACPLTTRYVLRHISQWNSFYKVSLFYFTESCLGRFFGFTHAWSALTTIPGSLILLVTVRDLVYLVHFDILFCYVLLQVSRTRSKLPSASYLHHLTVAASVMM